MQSFINKLNSDWGSESVEAGVLRLVVERVSEQAPGSVVDFPQNIEQEQLLKLLPYLVGDRLNLIESAFVFTDTNGQTYTVSSETIDSAMKTSIFTHPLTGEKINNFQDKINIKFHRR